MITPLLSDDEVIRRPLSPPHPFAEGVVELATEFGRRRYPRLARYPNYAAKLSTVFSQSTIQKADEGVMPKSATGRRYCHPELQKSSECFQCRDPNLPEGTEPMDFGLWKKVKKKMLGFL
ncbi:hypothetical protein VTN96DRAFT_5334 [Rasamsonia emersonii]